MQGFPSAPIASRGSAAASLVVALVIAGAASVAPAAPEASPPTESTPTVVFLDVTGPIGPATARHLADGLEEARDRGAAALVVEIDTPGGLDTSMREMIQDILAAPVPVVVHVAPRGARAASAGTYILYASHVAAMAPATSLGAATPVSLAGPGAPPEPGAPPQEGEMSAVDKKAMNDAAAFLRGLAELRDRDAGFADAAVREAATMSASEALEHGVIELIAADREELLAGLEGMAISFQGGERVLAVADAVRVELAPDWQTKLLGLLSNPNVAYLLLILGFYGLFFELSNPGAVLPGVAGAIALLLALYALHVLPVSFAGVALLLLGIGLMIGEAFAPSFGALGAGGLVAFVVGSVLLVDVKAPGFELSLPLIAVVAVTSAAFFILVIRMALRSRRRPVVTGREELIGMTGVAAAAFSQQGPVRVHGELWTATTDAPLAAGDHVEVVGARDLVLEVRPLSGALSGTQPGTQSGTQSGTHSGTQPGGLDAGADEPHGALT